MITLNQEHLGIPHDLVTYAREHPMIPLAQAAADAEHLAALKARPAPPPKRRWRRYRPFCGHTPHEFRVRGLTRSCVRCAYTEHLTMCDQWVPLI